MKAIYKYIMCAVAVLFAFASCDKNDDCSLDLNGNCLVEQITLDGYEGTVSLGLRSIQVRVPETADVSAMTVKSLKLSEGAKANIAEGQTINMESDQNIHVTNGDRYLDWTLSVLRDEAKLLYFVINDIYNGMIDEENKTVTVYVPGSVDITNAVASYDLSANATSDLPNGSAYDFSEPVKMTINNNTAHSEYTIKVIAIDKPKALFLGAASDMSKLDPEALAACVWMLANVPESMYASFADIQAGTIDISKCKIMWWHFHQDGGVDGHDPFIQKAPEAMAAKNQLRDFYENGGALFLTRYATILPSFIGVTGDDEWTTPQNCWGGNEDSAELCGGPWDFIKYDPSHPLFEGTIDGDDSGRIYCTDKGYHITNSTAQYHIGDDWGNYPSHSFWENRNGGRIIGVGGDGAIVAWEYPAHDGKGGIICIGSGCYDWYSYTFEDGYTEKFHKNIEIMTKNAINYLTK